MSGFPLDLLERKFQSILIAHANRQRLTHGSASVLIVALFAIAAALAALHATSQGPDLAAASGQLPFSMSKGPLPYGSVAGSVITPDGRPLPGVRVLAVTAEAPRLAVSVTMTDDRGHYLLRNIPPGSYWIAGGYANYPGSGSETVVRVDKGAILEGLNITQPRGYAIRGRLAVQPLLAQSRVVIKLRVATLINNGIWMEAPVGPDLKFEFPNVPPGSYYIIPNIQLIDDRQNFEIRVVDRDIEDLTLAPQAPGARVVGQITGLSPDAIPRGTVVNILWDTPGESDTPVNPDGSFEFLNAHITPETTFKVWAGGLPVLGSIKSAIRAGETTTVDAPVSFHAAITGHVVIEGLESPAPQAFLPASDAVSLYVLPPDLRQPMYLSMVDDDKGYLPAIQTPFDAWFKTSLPEGHYRLSLESIPKGYALKSIVTGDTDVTYIPLDIRPGRAPVEFLITLVPPKAAQGVISGQILHSDGTPAVATDVGLVNAERNSIASLKTARFTDLAGFADAVHLRDPRIDEIRIEAPDFFARTDGAGRYRIDNVTPGHYYVAVGVVAGPGAREGYWSWNGGRSAMGALMYYPGIPGPDATPIVITSGEERTIDLRLPADPAASTATHRLSGRIANFAAQPFAVGYRGSVVTPEIASAPEAWLYRSSECPPRREAYGKTIADFSGRIAPDGSFEVRNVPTGTYALCILHDRLSDFIRGSGWYGPLAITIANRDTTVNLEIGEFDGLGVFEDGMRLK